MAAGGFKWGSWDFLDYNAGTDINDIAVADEATLTSDAIDLDNKAACELSVKAIEDNTGAISGCLYVHVLRETEGGYQAITDPTWALSLEVVQNATRELSFSIDPGQMGSCKILVDNDSGQELAITIRIRTATFDSV